MRERTKVCRIKANPEIGKNKSGRWSDDDFGIWLADGVESEKMTEGAYRGKTISSPR